jgi:hypothetical protein
MAIRLASCLLIAATVPVFSFLRLPSIRKIAKRPSNMTHMRPPLGGSKVGFLPFEPPLERCAGHELSINTVVATITASWSDGSPFTGTLSFGPPYSDDQGVFAISGNSLINNPSSPGLSNDENTRAGFHHRGDAVRVVAGLGAFTKEGVGKILPRAPRSAKPACDRPLSHFACSRLFF